MVATDLDGTLVRSDLSVSPYTRGVFQRVQDVGIPVVAVTGRGPRLRSRIASELPVARYVVGLQGGCAWDQHTGEVLHLHQLPLAVMRQSISLLEAELGPLLVAAENAIDDGELVHCEHGMVWPHGPDAAWTNRANLFEGPVFKIFLAQPDRPADELLAAARRIVPPELASVTYGGWSLIEICPKGVNKATGLSAVARLLGVQASDVLAFGDMPNDLPMFDWAGRGVAVANAHPELLAAADAITKSNDDDGVARYLEYVCEPALGVR